MWFEELELVLVIFIIERGDGVNMHKSICSNSNHIQV